MTTRTRTVALTMAALMLASSLVITAPAAIAQDQVPTRPGVVFEPIPNLRQFLYARFGDVRDDTNSPDCPTAVPDSGAPRLALRPAEDGDLRSRPECGFRAGGDAATGLPSGVDFSTPEELVPNRRVTFTGNFTSFAYHHEGSVPTGVTLTITVRSDQQTVATGTLIGNSANESFDVPLTLAGPTANTGRVVLEANRTVTLSLTSAAAAPPVDQLPTGGVGSWTLDDTNTYLELRADDAIRAAAWITDERNAIRNVFAPIANDSLRVEDRDRRIVGHFALQSAFGADDARGPRDARQTPQFSVLLEGRSVEIGAGGRQVLTGVENSSASVYDDGVVVWTFPPETINYRGFRPGAYTLHVDMVHHQGGPINRQVDKTFNITAQSVRLAPFSEGTLVETQAHAVQPGGSTTYILAVNNTGSVNDTFTINVSAANAPEGWGHRIGGPDVASGRIAVPAGEARVFTVTVNAPFTGESATHLVNVTSTVDPAARSSDVVLVTSIRPDVIRELGIIVLQRDLTLDPGVEARIPIYVWNRGTRISNVSLEIQETSRAGWITDLQLGNVKVDRIVLSSIQPGDLAEATLTITGPLAGTIPTHTFTLNATIAENAGIATERTLTFALRSVAGVTVTALNTIGTRAHLIELSGPNNRTVTPPGQDPVSQENPFCNRPGDPEQANAPDCTDDGLHGTWFRLWVSNTGRVGDQFDLTADTFNTNCHPRDDDEPVFPVDGLNDVFAFYTRSSSGVPSRTSAVTVPAGETAEVYVFVPVISKDSSNCKGDESDETFSFVAQAKGRATGAIGRAFLEASARNSAGPAGHRNGVYLEGVVRESGYANDRPFVDIQNATKRTIVGATPPGQNLTYYVRMTNAASWSEYVDEDGQRVAPDLKVSLVGVKYEDGWNVSIRPVLESQNDILRNPYYAEYNLSNVHHFGGFAASRQGWFDRELEVVVQPPSIANSSALAGLRHEFQIIAQTNTTSDKSTLGIITVIEEVANITVRPDAARIFAHPGEPGAFLLLVSNNGSSAADVTLRAEMAEAPGAGAWQVNPNAVRFPLPAFKNRTIAVLVTPPTGATQGSANDVLVTVEYARTPSLPNVTTNVTTRLTAEVVAPGTLQLTPAAGTDTTIGPGGTANFTMTLRNSGSLPTEFRVSATPIPNWSVTASPDQGTLNPGETRTIVLVALAPSDVTNDTRFATVLRVQENGNAQNFDTVPFTINILGGKALPKLNVPNLVKRVDRAGSNNFEVQVQNVGSASGRIELEVRSQDPNWIAGIQDARGVNISGVQLGTNELVNINVSVRAPFNVPERTAVPVEIIAYSPDRTQSAKATLSAEVHDYGVQLTVLPSSRDALPGLPTEFTLRVRNTGNDNDTLNVSANLVDLPEWSVQLSSEEIRLEPNQEQEIRASIRSPTGPLPAARAYTFPFWVGTRGGQEVNISKNMTASAVITIPGYRSYDVDRDGQLEIAVDLDKRNTNGFEEFRDIFTAGLSTQVVARGLFSGSGNRTTFFLDVPAEGRPYDGVADIWFNPESVYAYSIVHAPDINGDGTPDYLLDTDQDGKIDAAFDTATERFWSAVEIQVYDDDRIQYLVDTTGDGRPDRFFDPETGTVTRTRAADDVGAEYVGIDVDDDERVDYYYNTRTRETSGAEVSNVGSFARDYWYFFVVFLALVALTVILIVRRNRAP